MKLNSIQFLRAIAAILVLYAHSIDLTMAFGQSRQQSFYYLSEIGCIGADLFFVLSGFIITYVAGQYTGIEQGVKFLQKRFYRVNLIYYIASFLFIGIIIINLGGLNSPSAFMLKRNLANSVVDSLWIVPVSGKLSEFKPLIAIGWTLAFEWLFYSVFFITILLRVQKKISALIIIILLLTAIGYLFKPVDFRLTFITNAIMLEFLLGVIICQFYLRFKSIHSFIPTILLLTGIIWCTFMVFYNYGNIGLPGPILNGSLSLNRFLLWGIPSGFITAGVIFLEKIRRANMIWDNNISRLIGDASYSIYLIHLTAFYLLSILYKKNGLFFSPDLSILFQIIVAVFLSILFYWWVEKPLLKWLHKPSDRTSVDIKMTAA